MNYLAKLRKAAQEDLSKDSLKETKKEATGQETRIVKPCNDAREASSDRDKDHSETSVKREIRAPEVYWESEERIIGPGVVTQHFEENGVYWLCVEYEGSWRWIRDMLLRSKQAFHEQEARQCRCCGGSDFWISKHKAIVCRRCHPPAHSKLEVRKEDGDKRAKND
jgi:hypothetical protein